MPSASLTADAFFNGRIQVNQERNGYRFSVDAVLLAHQVMPRPGETLLDLGCGCGIIALILAYRHPRVRIHAVEIQHDIAAVALHNVAENRMADRIQVHCKDMKALPDADLKCPVDWIVSNPPYRRAGSGRINPDRQRAIARHEIKVTLEDVASVSGRMLKRGGKLTTIYPAERLTDLLGALRAENVEPKRLRVIHSQEGTDARLVLVHATKGGQRGIAVEPPLYLYEPDGRYTSEVERMFAP